MTYRFSELTDLNTQSEFDKWVEDRKKDIKELAYENRRVIDKRSLEHEIDNFDLVKKAFKPLTSLRKKSTDYDAVFVVDNKGYTSFRVYFPITEKELNKSIDYRQGVIKKLGKWGSACISIDEAVWSVTHERVFRTLSFVRPITACQSFDKYGSSLVRKAEVFGFC